MARKKQQQNKSDAPPAPKPDAAAAADTATTDVPKKAEIQKRDLTTAETLLTMLKAILVLTALPLVNVGFQLCLQPIYGSRAVLIYWRYISGAAALLAAVLPLPMLRLDRFFTSERRLASIGATAALVAPRAYYWIGGAIARWHMPVEGATLTHVLITVPILTILMILLRNHLNASSANNQTTLLFAAPMLIWNFMSGIEPVYWEFIPIGDPINGSAIFVYIGAVLVALSFLEIDQDAEPKPIEEKQRFRNEKSRMTPLVLAALAIFVEVSTHYSNPAYPIIARGNEDHRLLVSGNGRLGLVAVGENVKDGYRYLRAGHSLLGGLWIGDKSHSDASEDLISEKFPIRLGDSVYSAFILQEGVRFFDRPASSKAEHQQNVLIIGLGVGIIPRSMVSHGLKVTILEIDKLVYQYAREYFGLHKLQLLENGTSETGADGKDGEIFIQDARVWTSIQNADEEQTRLKSYDYIVHDVFSGGSVPGHVFTVEFWEQLKELLRDDGVLAVNYAGTAPSHTSKAILTTLLHVFPEGTCRVYHDDMETDHNENSHHSEGDFFNMVIFCAKYKELKPRSTTARDYLKSFLREHILSTFSKRELPASALIGNITEKYQGEEEDFIITDEKNRLEEWQSKSAIEHWKLMRKVLPDEAWELY